MGVLDKVRDWVDKDRSIRRVADDPQLTSELILLVRMLFADGALKPEEVERFKRICEVTFGIPEKDVPGVLKFLQDFGYETTAKDAAASFAGMDDTRKRSLLLHMLDIARSDNFVHENEAELLRRVASTLNIGPEVFEEISR